MVNNSQYNERIIKLYEIIKNTNNFADLKTEDRILLNSFIFTFVKDANLLKELNNYKICLEDLYFMSYHIFKDENMDFKQSNNLFSIFRIKLKDLIDKYEDKEETFMILTNIENKPIDELGSYNSLFSIFDVSLVYPTNDLMVLKTKVIGKSYNYMQKKALNNIYSALGFFSYLSASGTKYTFGHDIKIDYSFSNYELIGFIDSKESLKSKTDIYRKRSTTTLLKNTQNRIFNHYLLLKVKKFLFIYKSNEETTEIIKEIFKDYFTALSEKNLEFSYIKLWLTIEKVIKQKWGIEKFSNFDEMIHKLLPILTEIINNRAKINNFYKKLDLFELYDEKIEYMVRDEKIIEYLDSLITLEDFNQIFKTLKNMKKYVEESFDDNNKKIIFSFLNQYLNLFIRVEFFKSEDIEEILISLKDKRNSYIHDNENYITQHDRNTLKIVLDYILEYYLDTPEDYNNIFG